jgi:hypothetical protein
MTSNVQEHCDTTCNECFKCVWNCAAVNRSIVIKWRKCNLTELNGSVWLRSTFQCIRRCSLSVFTKWHVGVGRGWSSDMAARRAVAIFLPVMELEPGRFSVNVTTLTELSLMSAAWYGTDYAANGISVAELWLIVQKTHADGRTLCRPPHFVQNCRELYSCNAFGEVYPLRSVSDQLYCVCESFYRDKQQ